MNSHRRICRPCQLAIEAFLANSKRSPRKNFRRHYASATEAVPNEKNTTNIPPKSTTVYAEPAETNQSTDPQKTVLNAIAGDVEIPSRPTATKARARFAEQMAMYSFKNGKFKIPWLSQSKASQRETESIDPDLLGSEADRKKQVNELHAMKPIDILDILARVNLDELIYLLEHYREAAPSITPIDRIFGLYESLPAPRVCYMERFQVRRLLKILSRQRLEVISAAQRYMTVIKDMQANRTTIRLSEWSVIIDAIGKGFLYRKKEAISAAQQTLADMEATGIKPSNVVLNQ